jgi:hypothetical protein
VNVTVALPPPAGVTTAWLARAAFTKPCGDVHSSAWRSARLAGIAAGPVAVRFQLYPPAAY